MIFHTRQASDNSLHHVQTNSDKQTEESATLSKSWEDLKERDKLAENLEEQIPGNLCRKELLSLPRILLNLFGFAAATALFAVVLGAVSNFHHIISHLSNETFRGFAASLIGVVWREFANSYPSGSDSEEIRMQVLFLVIGFVLFLGTRAGNRFRLSNDDRKLLLSITCDVNTVWAIVSWSIFPAACRSGNVGTPLLLITIIVVQCMLASLTRLSKKQMVAPSRGINITCGERQSR